MVYYDCDDDGDDDDKVTKTATILLRDIVRSGDRPDKKKSY